MNLLKAGGPESFWALPATLITGLGGYLIYKLLRMEYPEVGGAIGTTAGNAAATPASVAAVDATLLAVAEAAYCTDYRCHHCDSYPLSHICFLSA